MTWKIKKESKVKLSRVIFGVFIALCLSWLLISSFGPFYVDRGTLWENRRCRCYGFIVPMFTSRPMTDPPWRGDICLGIEAKCEVLADGVWGRDLWEEVKDKD